MSTCGKRKILDGKILKSIFTALGRSREVLRVFFENTDFPDFLPKKLVLPLDYRKDEKDSTER